MIRFLQQSSKTKKIVFAAILGMFCLILVITLALPGFSNSGFGGGDPRDPLLASVSGENINATEVLRAAQNAAKQQRLPAQFASFLVPQVLDRMISEKAELVEAQRRGYSVTDAELRDFLQHSPQFGPALFPDGKFIGQDKYENLLQSKELTVAEFEKTVTESLLADKLRSVVTSGITVADAELLKTYNDQSTKVKLEYAVISAEDIAKSVKPTEPELKKYYEDHKMEYEAALPEKRTVQYFVVPATKLSGTQVTEQDARNYYTSHQNEFSGEEQVKARHILIKVDPDADQKTQDAAKAKAEELLKKAKSGADFAELAKKNSDDTSAQSGGDLGWFNRGRMVKPFADAAFALNKGEISGLVKSQFGYHIIKLDDKRPAGTQPFEPLKDALMERLKTEKQQDAMQAMSGALQSQARSEGLAKAAAALGVTVHQETIVNGASVPDVGASPEFSEAVFGVAAKAPAQSVQLQQGIAVFQVDDVEMPVPPTFEQSREKVTADFKNARAAQMLQQKTAELSEKAKASHDLKSAARAAGATVKTTDLLGRNGQAPDIGSMQGEAGVAFSLKPGEISGPVMSGQKGIVLTVTQRQEPSVEEFAKNKERVREVVLGRKRQEATALFVNNLVDEMKKQGKIKRNEDQIKRIGKSLS